jgi:SAM-dependent methyltransferase
MTRDTGDDARRWDAAWSDSTFDDEVATLSYDWVQPTLQFITRNLEGCRTVLEAGCGPGRILHFLGENGYLPVGIDCSLTALLEARVHLPQGRLVLGDVLRLPFGDETFDAYISLGVIEHFPAAEVDRCLQEARRILRPGGGHWSYLCPTFTHWRDWATR